MSDIVRISELLAKADASALARSTYRPKSESLRSKIDALRAEADALQSEFEILQKKIFEDSENFETIADELEKFNIDRDTLQNMVDVRLKFLIDAGLDVGAPVSLADGRKDGVRRRGRRPKSETETESNLATSPSPTKSERFPRDAAPSIEEVSPSMTAPPSMIVPSSTMTTTADMEISPTVSSESLPKIDLSVKTEDYEPVWEPRAADLSFEDDAANHEQTISIAEESRVEATEDFDQASIFTTPANRSVPIEPPAPREDIAILTTPIVAASPEPTPIVETVSQRSETSPALESRAVPMPIRGIRRPSAPPRSSDASVRTDHKRTEDVIPDFL